MAEPVPSPPSFETALAEFETLVERMERGDITLEESVEAYERGVVLHRYCERALANAERRIRILAEDAAGSGAVDALQPFDTDRRDSSEPRSGEM